MVLEDALGASSPSNKYGEQFLCGLLPLVCFEFFSSLVNNISLDDDLLYLRIDRYLDSTSVIAGISIPNQWMSCIQEKPEERYERRLKYAFNKKKDQLSKESEKRIRKKRKFK
jgi:hypothetical protein